METVPVSSIKGVSPEQVSEPVIPDEVIDRLEFAEPGCTETDDLTWIVKELERLGAAFPPGFFDQSIETVREGLKAVARSERVRETYRREQESKARRKREICTTDAPTHEMAEEALAVLQMKNNPPEIFARAAQLVRAVLDEKKGLYIQEIREAELSGILDRSIVWTRVTPKGEVRQSHPPREVVKDILALPAIEWGVPPLSGVTQTPIFHQDGSIHATPGYDEQTGLYYFPTEGFSLLPVPEVPTREDIAAALEITREIFVDFPFVGQADRANAYGALLTAILRPCIMGAVPLYLCDKPQAGSGAGLLQRIIGVIALGHEPPLRTMPGGEEMRKELFTILRNGARLQIYDNIEDRLSSPELAAALTAQVYTGRILGRSEEKTLEVSCFWMANGNNVAVGGDLARRTFKSRIDPQVAMPWQREGFLHPDIIAWAGENQGRILAAVFTLARAWIQAGKPLSEQVPRVGSFEAWRDMIGGVLEHAGVAGFMANADEIYLEGDADRLQWEDFLQALWDFFGCAPFTAGAVASLLASDDPSRVPLLEVLPDNLAESFQVKRGTFSRVLGNAFAKVNGRHFPGGYCLNQGKWSRGTRTWVITCTTPLPASESGVVSHGVSCNSGDVIPKFTSERDTPRVSVSGASGASSFNPNAGEKNKDNILYGAGADHEAPEAPLQKNESYTGAVPDSSAGITVCGETPQRHHKPIPPGCLKHPIEMYEQRKYDPSIKCIVSGCGRPGAYGVGAGYPLCEGHYHAAKAAKQP